jgi:hypothetical protein
MTSPVATTPVGAEPAAEPEFVAPRPGERGFIGPIHTGWWTFIQPTAGDLQSVRDQNFPIVVDDDPMEALQVREGEVHPRQRSSMKFVLAKEKAGQWLALNLSARGIATGSYEALMDLGDAIRIARRVAEGEKINGCVPSVEDRVKAVQAIAAGVKSYSEMSETLIKQLQPVAPEKPNAPAAPRGPSRDQPVTAIQAENVYINGNQQSHPANNGTSQPEHPPQPASE